MRYGIKSSPKSSPGEIQDVVQVSYGIEFCPKCSAGEISRIKSSPGEIWDQTGPKSSAGEIRDQI